MRTLGKRGSGAPLLSCYFPLGDPLVPVDLLDLYAEHGVDVVEIGLASPDPYLDGPDVRQSMARADRGRARADLDAVLDRLARQDRPMAALLMTYADAGHPGLDDAGFWAGLDSLLVVAPPADPLRHRLERTAMAAGLQCSAFLSLPLSDGEVAAARDCGFYVMLQAVAGVTGPRAAVDPDNAGRIALLRRLGIAAPILAGFGVSRGAHARELVRLGADGVVVGSEVLRACLAGSGQLGQLLGELREGLDG